MAEPDTFEKRVRFVFGFVFGVGSGLAAATRWPAASTLFLLIFVGSYALVCGLLAMRWGDRFWTSGRWWW